MVQNYGKYVPVKTLGRGASGTVYLAEDTFSGDRVALKVLDPEVVAAPELDKTHMRQFVNEASLAGKLNHPHIASILEAVVSDGAGYIALEYVPGGDLSQFTLPGKRLSVHEGIEIAFKTCGALDYAFKQGVVHRDIKPANIMVVNGTNIKIVDFGAAYLHKSDEAQISSIGSPLYMSPEQVTGAPLGHQSDMFSLGVVLYELFTGQRPFVGESLVDVFAKILNEDPPPPSSVRPELPEGVDRFVMKMLRKSPGERYDSWAELALEIADVGSLSMFRNAIPDSERFTGLRSIAVLGSLSDAEIWELVHAAKWRRVPGRTVLMKEGEEGESLYLLARGDVKITKRGRLLNMLGAGEYFGEMAYFKGGALRRQATAETATDALIAEFVSGALQKVSANCQLGVTNALVHALIERLALADERITNLAT